MLLRPKSPRLEDMRHGTRVAIALLLFIAILLIGKRVFAASIPQIGPHTPLLKIEKNENPQNSMVVYTKIDPKTCAFAAGPVLDEYWMMDGTRYKRVNPLIKEGIRKRFELDRQAFKRSGRFLVRLRDFHEVKSDLGSEPVFEVLSSKEPGGCQATVKMTLGPSDHGRTVEIESIYADSSRKFLPPFRKLNSLTLIGRDVATGEKIRRTYSAN